MSAFNGWVQKPNGILQADGIGGLSTRTANQTLQPDEPATYRVDLTFGNQVTPGVAAGQIFSNTGSKFNKQVQGVSEILLSQIQWQTVGGVASGNGYCRFRLKVNDQEMWPEQGVTNTNYTTHNGFVLFLDSTSGSATFNPPLHIFTHKGGQGLFAKDAIVELAIQDQSGNPRTYQQVSLLLLANSKYYQ